MAEKHPYVSGTGPIIQVLNHLRDSFPEIVDSQTLKKLGYAPSNESYVLNILRYLGVIDKEGKRTDKASEVFSQHADKDFQKGFASLVKSAYSDLFALYGDKTWTVDRDHLITFFRTSDSTTALVGGRQATTFHALSGLAGKKELPQTKAKATSKPKKTKKPAKKEPADTSKKQEQSMADDLLSDLGLTVRIEINLPAEADQETYDRIFRSLRENLLSAR